MNVGVWRLNKIVKSCKIDIMDCIVLYTAGEVCTNLLQMFFCGFCFLNVVGDALDCHRANSVLHSATRHQHGVREKSARQLLL